MSSTKVNFEYTKTKIGLNDNLVFLGSCFATNVGNEFKSRKLEVLVNPLGVVFHPNPLFEQIKKAINGDLYRNSDFFLHDKYWFNHQLSGTCAKPHLSEAKTYANTQLTKLAEILKTATKLFITFGTATGYLKNETIVANCHKQSLTQFQKITTEPQAIVALGNEVIDLLQGYNSNLEIILTVSPIRYKKDGLMTNSVSKSALLLAANQLAHKRDGVSYLPAYELVIDELRDYKWFENDGVHPNRGAVQFVFNEISQKLCDEKLLKYLRFYERLMLQVNHKALHPFSDSNIKFLSNLLTFIHEIQMTYKVDLIDELNTVNERYKKATAAV